MFEDDLAPLLLMNVSVTFPHPSFSAMTGYHFIHPAIVLELPTSHVEACWEDPR